MVTESKTKRLVTSFHNLSPEQQNEVKTLYPQGFADVMMRIDKPDGTFFYVVPFETADTYYLVKIDVKIDDATEETDDGFYDSDDIKGADELSDETPAEDDGSGDDF